MHPALRASTQRLVKTAPLACWWQVYRVYRPSERCPSAMARCGQITCGDLAGTSKHTTTFRQSSCLAMTDTLPYPVGQFHQKEKGSS